MPTEVDVETVESYVSMIRGLDTRKVIIGLAVLAAGIAVSRFAAHVMGKALKRSKTIDPAAHTMIKTALRIVLDVVFVLVAANTMGIPITSFVALLSVVGIAVSLAVQGTLSNVVGGVIILASHPFTIGDYVEQDGYSGTVKEIGLLHTRLLTPDGRMIFVPNATLQTSRLINYSTSPSRRMELSISAAYSAAPDQVRAAISDAISRCPDIQSDPAPVVHLESYDDSGIRYTVLAWAPGPAFISSKYLLNEQLYSAFRRAGIEIPFPQMDVHVKS